MNYHPNAQLIHLTGPAKCLHPPKLSSLPRTTTLKLVLTTDTHTDSEPLFFFKGHHSGRASGTDQRKGLVAVQSPESKRHRAYPLHTDTHSKTCCQGYSSHTCSEFHELLKMTELNTHHHNPIIRFFPALEGIKHGGGDRPHIISVYE